MTETAGAALARAARQLAEAGVPEAARDARRLLAHAARVDASRVTLIAPDPLSPEIAARFAGLIAARAERVPVAHLTGTRQFYGRQFTVTPDVLDPRPETEVLIEAALAEPFARVLDLGTGSGCILLTLLAERDGALGLGVDLSAAACLVAAANADALGLAARADIRASDWFTDVDGRFDLIVSNPPYIAADEMAGLSPEVQREPVLALTDGGDGLSAYAAILAGAPPYLAPGGRVLLEIGPTQASAVVALAEAQGFAKTVVLTDFDGRDRVVGATLPT